MRHLGRVFIRTIGRFPFVSMRAVLLLMSDQQQHLSDDEDAQNLIQIMIFDLQKSENFLACRRLSGHPFRHLLLCRTAGRHRAPGKSMGIYQNLVGLKSGEKVWFRFKVGVV